MFTYIVERVFKKVANYTLGVNPQILKWAREKAGYSLEDVAKRFKKDVTVIENWESGKTVPTYNQLEKLAYSLYKRPIALFFFPKPPDEPDTQQSFRTLPDFEIASLHPDTRYAIRQAQAMQLTLDELNDGVNPSEHKIFRDIKLNTNLDISLASITIRNYLGIPLENQFKWKNTDVALNNWRNTIQDYGVFVFKRSFKQQNISGFCLSHQEFPVIYLNNSNSVTRQIFTLFHELAHVLLNVNGVTKENDQHIKQLIGKAKDIEVFCNLFASEFLVPDTDFDKKLNTLIEKQIPMTEVVDKLALQYKVSREVILRKLLNRQEVSQIFYEKTTKEWIEAYKKGQKEKTNGGNYYATQATYLGNKYLELAFSKYYQGQCTLPQLAGYLNIKAKSVVKLEQFMLGKTTN